MRIVYEDPDHQKGDGAERNVDIEIPAPVPVVGDPTAQGGTEDRGDHQADTPRRHRELLLLNREGLHQNGL